MSEQVEETQLTVEDILKESQEFISKLTYENLHLSALVKKQNAIIKDLGRQLSDLSD